MVCHITYQVGWGMNLVRLHWYECLQCSPPDRPARLFSLPEFRSLARCPDCGRQGLHVMETLERVPLQMVTPANTWPAGSVTNSSQEVCNGCRL